MHRSPSRTAPSLAEIEGLIVDMDGVLWRGDKPMPGLNEFFAFLRERDIHIVLAKSSRHILRFPGVDRGRDGMAIGTKLVGLPVAYADHLARPGASALVEVFTSRKSPH